MKHSAITRTISDIKIPNWLIMDTIYKFGSKTSALLIYISIMSRATLMMDGWYTAILSVDDIVNDWDFDEFSINHFGCIQPMDYYLDYFYDVMKKHTLVRFSNHHEMDSDKHYTYKIKAAHGPFYDKISMYGSDVYLSYEEVHKLMSYTKPRKECAVILLCFIRFKMPSIYGNNPKTAVIGQYTLINKCLFGEGRTEYTIKLLENWRMIDFYKVCERDENGNRVKSELFGNAYVPVYTIPGLADERDAYECAIEFLKRQNGHRY